PSPRGKAARRKRAGASSPPATRACMRPRARSSPDKPGRTMSAAGEPDGFDEAFRRRLRELFVWRRDVRRFRGDPLPPGTIERLIEAACLSPSVGLSQPWRFVLVDDPGRRRAVLEDFRACNADALNAYAGDAAARYAALKL